MEALSTALAAYGQTAGSHRPGRHARRPGHVDIFTQISRGVDQWLWFVEAHLQASTSTS